MGGFCHTLFVGKALSDEDYTDKYTRVYDVNINE